MNMTKSGLRQIWTSATKMRIVRIVHGSHTAEVADLGFKVLVKLLHAKHAKIFAATPTFG